MNIVAFALALQGLSPEQLSDALFRKLEGAKTLRVEEELVARSAYPQGNYKARVVTLVKGDDRWFTEFRVTEGGDPAWAGSMTRYDGRRVRVDAPGALNLESLKPGVVAPLLRRQFATGIGSDLLIPILPDGKRFKKETGPVRDGGRERVDGKDLRLLIRDTKSAWGESDPFAETVILYVDVDALRPVRAEGVAEGMSWTSTFRVFAVDEPLDDAAFALRTERDLDRARARHAARSVDLFARFTGRLPRSLDELTKRPADLPAEIYFPEAGFTLDGRAPAAALKDGAVVAGSESVPLPRASGRAVGAPSERLRRHYDARVRLHLLVSAVEAFHDAEGAYPKRAADLWTSDPAWIPGGALPADPWGRPFRLITETDRVRAQVVDLKERRLTLKSLTPEEKAALEAAARPRPTEDDRKNIPALLDRAIDDDLETRDEARRALLARGPAVLPFLEERLKAPPHADAVRWLQRVREDFPQAAPAWLSELGALSASARRSAAEDGQGTHGDNERNASASLKTLASAQADFRGNDRDDNKIQDFWTGDVAGLYAVKTRDGQTIKLIELAVAAADAAPLEGDGPWQKIEPREPKAGYQFQAMVLDASAEPPEAYRQDTKGERKMGKVHNTSRFGFCAFPAEYGVGGVRTFILNEGNTLFAKDTGGEPVLEWPSDDELRREWAKVD